MMIKLSLNALESRRLAKSFGLIFEGTGRIWALRNLRSGKTMEQLGAVGKKHLSDVMPVAKRLARGGREVGMDIYKTRRSVITKGAIGGVSNTNLSEKIVKTFHTHPYSGLAKIKPEEVMRSQLRSNGMPSKDINEILKDRTFVRHIKKQMKFQGPMPTGVAQAHPDPLNFASKGKPTDMNFMSLMPKSHHNILATDPMILGVHKIRPKGLRTFYQKV